MSCTVEAYDSEAFEYTVRLASSTDDTEDTATSSSSSSTATTTTTRPRILVLFAAEDPEVFADRVLAAYNLRRDTEVQNIIPPLFCANSCVSSLLAVL